MNWLLRITTWNGVDAPMDGEWRSFDSRESARAAADLAAPPGAVWKTAGADEDCPYYTWHLETPDFTWTATVMSERALAWFDRQEKEGHEV